MTRVRLDPGHASPLPAGGTDPGVVANGVQEAECVLEIGKLVAAMLRANGVAVDMTRTGIPGPSANDRAKHLRRPGVDCSISLHANGHTTATANGCEVFVSAFNSRSQRLGELIVESWSWVHGIGLRVPPVKTRLTEDGQRDWYYFIREPQSAGVPAVLVEVGFVTNPRDAQVLASFWGRFQIAYAITRGVIRFLDVPTVEELLPALTNARAALSQIHKLAEKGGAHFGSTD